MPFKIVKNDITKMKVDAIVNTANPRVNVGRGVEVGGTGVFVGVGVGVSVKVGWITSCCPSMMTTGVVSLSLIWLSTESVYQSSPYARAISEKVSPSCTMW